VVELFDALCARASAGSPFMVKVTGEGKGRLTEKLLRHHDAPDVAEVGSDCELSLKIPSE